MERLSRGPAVLWHPATVTRAHHETWRTRTLGLSVPSWPGHRAGQHVDVRLTAADGYQAQRSYSLASAPELEELKLTVELVDGGEVSEYLVEELQPGDMFDLRGPIGGHFSWSVDDGGPLLLIAAGSGLVPLMAMLRHRAARASDVPARLLLSARTDKDALFGPELATLAAQTGMSVHHTYTRGAPRDWTGWVRRVDAAMLAEVGPDPALRPRVFVCGPAPFVEAVTGLLVAAGHELPLIHPERFGPSGP